MTPVELSKSNAWGLGCQRFRPVHHWNDGRDSRSASDLNAFASDPAISTTVEMVWPPPTDAPVDQQLRDRRDAPLEDLPLGLASRRISRMRSRGDAVGAPKKRAEKAQGAEKPSLAEANRKVD